MLTKGAIGNLVNRYKAVLEKCNLLNAFGSLASCLLPSGGKGVASQNKRFKSSIERSIAQLEKAMAKFDQ